MKHYSKLFKRVQAWVLVIAMLFPILNSGFLLTVSAEETEPSRETVTVTEGEIVANNYPTLSDAEKELLSSGLLAGVSHTIAIPDAGDGLVSVDQDNRTIEVKAWTDENGYVWKPVAVRIMVGTEEKEAVTLTDGKGSYTYDGNAFSVHVDYEVRVDVSVDTQKNLWNAAGNLKDGLAYLKRVKDANVVISEIASDDKRYDSDGDGVNDWTIMDVLEHLAEETFPLDFPQLGNPTIGFTDAAGKEAVAALRQQMDQNKLNAGKETFDLCLDVDAYDQSASKIRYLVDRDPAHGGARLNNNFRTTYEQVGSISSALTAFEQNLEAYKVLGANTASSLENLAIFQDILQEWLDATRSTYNAGTWVATSTDIVRTGLADFQWQILDAKLSAIDIRTPAPAEFKTSLLAATTTIQHNMQMYDVTVKVVLQVADGDGTQLKAHGTKTDKVTLAKGATEDEILTAIAATGVEAEALEVWTAASVYADGQFKKAIAGIPAELTADIDVTITYSPVTYTVTYGYAAEQTLYYGARIYLPLHEDQTQSYDYDVNGSKKHQGAWVTITGDTSITRTEGKAYVATPLNQLVGSVVFENNKNAADVLNSGALTIGNENQMIRYPDATNVTLKDGVLTAKGYPSGYMGLEWVPATYTIYNNGDTPVTRPYEEPVTLAIGSYDSVTVTYELTMPAEGVLELVNLPYDLWKDVQDQKAAMSKLASQKDNLSLLNRSLVGLVVTQLKAGSAEDKELASIFEKMVNDPACMGSEYFVLYELLENYSGLEDYYKKNVEFNATVDKLEGYLAQIVEYRTALTNLLNGFSSMLPAGKTPDEIISKIDTLKDIMAQLKDELKLVDERVDVSKDLDVLLNAVSGATNPFDKYEAAPAVVLTEDFDFEAPDKTSVKITLAGGGVKDETITKIFGLSEAGVYVLTEDDVNAIRALVEAAVTVRDGQIDSFFYNKVDTIDWNSLVGSELTGSGLGLNVTWMLKTFDVQVKDEEGNSIDTYEIDFVDRVVSLPASEDSNLRYDYYLNGQKLSFEGGKYTFSGVEDTFKSLFVTGSCDIKLVIVDIQEELAAAKDAELIGFVDGMNDSIDSGAMTFSLVKNGDKYSVIMKIDGAQPNALAGAVEGLAMGFVRSGYSTIAVDNKGVFENSQISLQALIDAIMNSGFNTNDLAGAIDDNGKIIEFDLGGDLLTGDDRLGGKLIQTTMQLTKGDETREMDFYITLSSASAEIVQIRDLLTGKMGGYFSVGFDDGKTTVYLKVPEKAYEAYLAGLLVTGYLDIRDMDAMKAQIAGKFMFDVVHPLFGENSSLDTLRYTLDKFGFEPDLSADELETLFNMVRDRHEGAYNSIEFDETSGTIVKRIPIKQLVDSMNVPDTLTSFIKEYETGLVIRSAASFPQVGNEYDAAYVDVRSKSKLDMVGMIKDGGLATKNFSGAAVVVLLGDIEGNLEFDYATILNLNGFDISGNVTATGGLTIVDSSMEEEPGQISGTLSGSVSVLGGRYTSRLNEAMLPDGYEQDSFGVVHSQFYDFVKDDEGNITIEINAGILSSSYVKDNFPDVKFMVLDLVMDMFFNGYTTNHLEINDQLVYHLGVDDFVGLYTGEDRVGGLIDAVRGMFNVQDLVDIMNLVIDDVTDFEALYNAVANDEPLFSYDLTTGSWKILTGIETDEGGDYFTIGIGTGNVEERVLHVKVVGEDEDKQYLMDLLEQFRDTTDININLAPIQGSYDSADKDIQIGWGGYGTVVVDFTKNSNYAVMFGVLLADGLYGTETSEELVAAIREYYETGNIHALKTAFNAVTVSEMLDTVLNYTRGDSMTKMLNRLGLSDVVPADVTELEGLYDQYAKVLTAVARRIDARFDLPESGRTMGSMYNSKLGGYGFSKENINKTYDRDFLRGYGLQLTANIEKVSLLIRIFEEDQEPNVDYSKLEAALKTAAELINSGAESLYTADSWANMMEKYNAALQALASMDQEEVDKAAEDLLTAINSLEKKPDDPDDPDDPELNFEKLRAAIEGAKKLIESGSESEYTADSWADMIEAYNHAIDVLANSLDQIEINNAADRLVAAMEALVRVEIDKPIFKDEDGKLSFDSTVYTNIANFKIKGSLFIVDAYMGNPADGQTIGQFLEIVHANLSDGLTACCYEADGLTMITDMNRLIFTGAVCKIMDGEEVVDTFTVAVAGDLDGDGVSSAKDSFLTKFYAAQSNHLADHIFAALDIYDDGTNKYNAKDAFMNALKAADWEAYKAATAES